MDMKPTPVRLSRDAISRIDALVGNYGRAAFIREAVGRELERREKSDGLDTI